MKVHKMVVVAMVCAINMKMIDNNTRNEEVTPIKVYRMFSCLSSTSKAAAEKESRLFLIIVYCVWED